MTCHFILKSVQLFRKLILDLPNHLPLTLDGTARPWWTNLSAQLPMNAILVQLVIHKAITYAALMDGQRRHVTYFR